MNVKERIACGHTTVVVACEPTNCWWKGGGGSRLEERENWRKVKMPKKNQENNLTKDKITNTKKGSRLEGRETGKR